MLYICSTAAIIILNILIMKKLVTLAAAFLFIAGLGLTSCNTNQALCPAYPPAPYQGDNYDNTDDADNVIGIEEQKNL